MPDANIRDTRSHLDRWGRWWRHREERDARTGLPSRSPAHAMMELARVGCRVSGTRTGDADSIRPPQWVQAGDAAIEQLPQAQRAAIAHYYVRRTLHRRNPAVLRAELALAASL